MLGKLRCPRVRAAILAGVVCLAQPPGEAAAQSRIVTFDIPGQSLSQSLRDYARISSQQIIFTEDLVAGKTTRALRGDYDADTALTTLLAGSGLVVERSSFGAAMIRRQRVTAARPPPAREEAPPPSSETIIVTGTRIIANGYQAPTPVTTLDAENLHRNTPESIPAGLEQLPQFTMTAGANVANSQAGTPNAGNYLNLRGLGAIESLVLMDGHRLPATSYSGTVDANIIPQAFIQRVDVVTGGASANYGSGAVSGVINFVTDRKFDGLKGEIQSGISAFGDDAQFKFSLAGGASLWAGRGHVEASYDHFEQPGIACPRRVAGDCDRPNAFGYSLTGTGVSPASAYVLSKPVAFNNGTYGTLITSASNAVGDTVPFAYNGYQFLTGGVIAPFNPGTPTGTPNYSINGDGAVTFGTTLTASAATDQAYGRFDYDLTPDTHAFASLIYSQAGNSYVTVADGSQVNAFHIFQDNAFLPAAVAAQMRAQNIAYFTGSRFEADQPEKRVNTVTSAYIAQMGLEGVWQRWHWNIDYTSSHARLSTTQQGNFRYTNWYPALDAVRDPASNQIVCRVALTNPGLKPGCVPWNPFGEGSPSAAAYDYINGTLRFAVRNTQNDLSAQVSGVALTLPAGPVHVSAGVEYRDQTLDQISNNDPSQFIDQAGFCHRVDAGGAPTGATVTAADCNAFAIAPGIVSSATSPSLLTFSTSNVGPSSGKENIVEVFAEAAIPLFQDLPALGTLDTDLAFRFAQYSTSGSADTWKLGINWQPLKQLRVRATMSRDFRAPTLYELFAGQSATFSQFNDIIHSGVMTHLITLSGGNPKLQPEIGNTSTAGMVWSPEFIDGFTASLDYYTIRITNQIAKLTSGVENQICEASGGTDPLCAFIVRPTAFADHSAASFPFSITTVPYNQASVSQAGFDLDMSYALDMGRIFSGSSAITDFRFIGVYIPSLLSYTGVGGRVLQGAGAGNIPKVKFNLNANYIDGPLNLGARLRFIGPVYYSHDPKVFYTYNGGLQAGAQAYLDLNLSYAFKVRDTSFSVYGGIANLFNTFVFVPNASEPFEFYPTNQALYDVVGRYFNAGVRFRL